MQPPKVHMGRLESALLEIIVRWLRWDTWCGGNGTGPGPRNAGRPREPVDEVAAGGAYCAYAAQEQEGDRCGGEPPKAWQPEGPEYKGIRLSESEQRRRVRDICARERDAGRWLGSVQHSLWIWICKH